MDAFEDARAFQLVVEFCGGGELFDKVTAGTMHLSGLWMIIREFVPFGNLTWLLNMTIYSGFTH